MPSHRALGLNDSGEDARTCIVRGGALHLSRGRSTQLHAHPAWKLVVGMDAALDLESATHCIPQGEGLRAVLVAPNMPHRIGCAGWSAAYFVQPLGRAWSDTPALMFFSRQQERAWMQFSDDAMKFEERSDVPAMLGFLRRQMIPGSKPLDARVERVQHELFARPSAALVDLAQAMRISLDRLSHIVVEQTGLSLRSHRLWTRLLGVLHAPSSSNLAQTAAQAGFSDHAHLTRTYRRFLGRLPSEFLRPPTIVEPWLG